MESHHPPPRGEKGELATRVVGFWDRGLSNVAAEDDAAQDPTCRNLEGGSNKLSRGDEVFATGVSFGVPNLYYSILKVSQ
ncbi:hypothetical protein GOP47_0003009 [Adiantum capillus-veneris]|uniref:Uncharacterized protein n=1 Tax=Adiantum capillus-veneris TaxID=13818 RepID=A0A9D4VB61_ADICA|nr:hypothetical protein GOP47_0003009 [Adiantum capillus-veneris]